MKRPPLRWLLTVAGVLLWLIAVLPAYYVVHKPLPGETAPSPISTPFSVANTVSCTITLLADLGLLALTLLIAAAWGGRLGRRLCADLTPGLEHWALGTTLGLGLLGSLVLGLAAVGGLYRWPAYGLLLTLGLAALPELRVLFTTGQHSAFRIPHPALRTPHPWLWLYTVLIGLLAFGTALLPPTGWDALVYHLQGPRLYVEAHRLVAVPENVYLNWPAQMDMLFTWGLLLKGDTLAQLFHWVFWPLTAALLYLLVRRTVDTQVGSWAVTLWASVPFARELAGVAYADLGLTAFILAAFYAFLRWDESSQDGWLALSALFLGLAMATKYTAVTWLGLLVLLAVYRLWRHGRRPVGWGARRIVGFGLIAALPVVPWLAKNWLVTGNPVYPFLWGGLGWNPTRQAWLTWPGYGYSRNPLDYLALPWLMTVLGRSGTAAFDATTGPLLLCLVPPVFLVRGRPRPVNYGLVLVGGQLAYFAVTIYHYVYLVETRLLLPAFPLLCLAGAYAFHCLRAWDRQALRLSRVVGGVVALVLIATLATEAYAVLSGRPLAPLFGLESRADYLARRLGAHFAAMNWLNERLPAASRTLFLWEPRGYYCRRPAQPDATLDALAQLRVSYPDAESALVALRADGFTHLLLYRAGLEFLRGPTPRPPTLESLIAPSAPGRSLYPLTADDMGFLNDLLTRCHLVQNLGDIYEIYQLP